LATVQLLFSAYQLSGLTFCFDTVVFISPFSTLAHPKHGLVRLSPAGSNAKVAQFKPTFRSAASQFQLVSSALTCKSAGTPQTNA
jgi:hypothetical protein